MVIEQFFVAGSAHIFGVNWDCPWAEARSSASTVFELQDAGPDPAGGGTFIGLSIGGGPGGDAWVVEC